MKNEEEPSHDSTRRMSRPGQAAAAAGEKPASSLFPEMMMEVVVDSANMRRAWQQVLANRGAPGPDGIGDGRMSLKYLATYVFRVGISDHRIGSCENGMVSFSYRRSGTNSWKPMKLSTTEFIHRFLQHVLPRGLQKVRHYGFLGPQSPLSIEAVRWLVTLHNGEPFVLVSKPAADTPIRPTRRCEDCGGLLRVIAMFSRRSSAIHDTS